MSVLYELSVALRTSTSTLHFRPLAWKMIFSLILFIVCLTSFFWIYCSNAEYDESGNLIKEGNCPVGNRWDRDYWGDPYCLSGYCETCYMQDYVRSRANSYSNVAFVAGGIIIMGFTIEDFIFFNLQGQKAKRPRDDIDYDSNNPPNLILGGAGPFQFGFGLLGTASMVYAAVGAFVFHAGMTPLSNKWDICSVYTLVWFGLPYMAMNHLHCIKRHYPKTIITLVSVCMLLAFILPYKFHKNIQAEREVPRMAALNFAILFTGYVVGTVSRQVRLRRWTDLWILIVATGLMMFAYVARESDMDWCDDEDSFVQGHAVWHSCMAIGITFFYLFLRQERPWHERRDSLVNSQWMERDKAGEQGENAML